MRISDWSSDVCSSDLLSSAFFVEGWPMNAEERAALHARVAAHSNLRLQQRTHDMREVYRRTHTLLVPSQWEEAWGRVATEAQFSGRSEEHTSELQSLMRISYAVLCLKKQTRQQTDANPQTTH